MEDKWYELERKLKPEAQENTDKEKLPYKYEMLFVRGLSMVSTEISCLIKLFSQLS